MTFLKINNIPLKVLASGGFSTAEVSKSQETWSATGSFIRNKQAVKNSYSFKLGYYTDEEANFIVDVINGKTDCFKFKLGLESTTGLQPLSSHRIKLGDSQALLNAPLRYDLQLSQGHQVYVHGLHGVHIFDYDTNGRLDNVPIGVDIFNLSNIFTVAGLFPNEPLNGIIRTYTQVPTEYQPYMLPQEWGDSPFIDVSGDLFSSSVRMVGRASTVQKLSKELNEITVELFEIDERYVKSR